MDLLVVVNCNSTKFFKILTNYENLSNYLPVQLRKIQILEKEARFTTLEIVLVFKTLVKKEIAQRVRIEEKSENELFIEVLDGHAKNTKVLIIVESKDNKTAIKTEIDLKLSLKAKILSPIIKREYKNLLRGTFLKIAVDAEKKLEVS